MMVKKRKPSTVRPARPGNKRGAFEDQTVGDVLSTRVKPPVSIRTATTWRRCSRRVPVRS